MKKCILLVLSFCFIFLISFKAHADIMPDWAGPDPSKLQTSIVPVDEWTTFNIIKGCQEDMMTNTPFYGYADRLAWTLEIQSGGFYYDGIIYDAESDKDYSNLYVEITFENSSVKGTTILMDGDIIYKMETTLCDDPHVSVNKEIDLNEYYGTNNRLFRFSSTTPLQEISDTVMLNDHTWYEYESTDFALTCFLGTIYKENPTYEGKELNFFTNVVNPISEEDLLNTIVVKDHNDGLISKNARIIDSEYILNEGKIDLGKYPFRIVASDEEGNTTVQNAFMNVVDVNPPSIIAEDRIEREYCMEIKDIESLFTVSDDSGNYTFKIIENNYTPNFSKLGDHTITAEAVDSYGNRTTKTITIHVIDLIAPYFVLKDATVTTTNPINDIDSLDKFITCTDYIDKNNTYYEITDLDGYFDNPTIKGDYKFQLIGYDQSKNSCKSTLILKVLDDDYPIIYADKYTIAITNKDELTQDAIINILINVGQIDSATDVNLKSSYFDSPNIEGNYDLIVSTPNGVYTDLISVKDTSNTNENNQDNNVIDTIDYTIPIVKEKKDMTYLYVALGIVGLVLILSLGFVIYKRKH